MPCKCYQVVERAIVMLEADERRMADAKQYDEAKFLQRQIKLTKFLLLQMEQAKPQGSRFVPERASSDVHRALTPAVPPPLPSARGVAPPRSKKS